MNLLTALFSGPDQDTDPLKKTKSKRAIGLNDNNLMSAPSDSDKDLAQSSQGLAADREKIVSDIKRSVEGSLRESVTQVKGSAHNPGQTITTTTNPDRANLDTNVAQAEHSLGQLRHIATQIGAGVFTLEILEQVANMEKLKSAISLSAWVDPSRRDGSRRFEVSDMHVDAEGNLVATVGVNTSEGNKRVEGLKFSVSSDKKAEEKRRREQNSSWFAA